MKKTAFALFIYAFCAAPFLHARIYVNIDQPPDQKLSIAIPNLVSLHGGKKYTRTIPTIIQEDLTDIPYLQFIPPETFLEEPDNKAIAVETIDFDFWTATGAQILIKGGIEKVGSQLIVKLILFDPSLKRALVTKEYRGDKKDAPEIAHLFAIEVVVALTGITGPFNK